MFPYWQCYISIASEFHGFTKVHLRNFRCKTGNLLFFKRESHTVLGGGIFLEMKV